MEQSIVISGFGGQGALLAGKVLAQAAMTSGRYVTWLPSYGPEMRGGTAHCTVIIGDEPIGAPLVEHPDVVVAMNLPSVEKYAPQIRPGGLLVYNSDLVPAYTGRVDLQVLAVPANTIALKHGDVRLANLVLVGVLVEDTGIVTLAQVEAALAVQIPARYAHLLQANRAALHEGAIYFCTLEPA